MTCTVHRISGPPQIGKTTMALGMLERLHSQGIKGLYIVPTRMHAREVVRMRKTVVECVAWIDVIACVPAGVRAVAVDDFDLVPLGDREEGFYRIIARLNSLPGPTQLILVHR